MKAHFLLLLLLCGALFGEESIELSVDAQIQEIQSAQPKERVKLMNAFKERLFKMNQEERVAAISSMRAKMNHKNTQETEELHTTQMQMQHNVESGHKQMMNQQQSTNQLLHGDTPMTHTEGGGMPFDKRMGH